LEPGDTIGTSSPRRLIPLLRQHGSEVTRKRTYTDKHGQYLAFIYYFTKIHGCSSSEAEMQRYFRVSPPAVHQIHLLVSQHELPDLA
jgi:hypothetical protein